VLGVNGASDLPRAALNGGAGHMGSTVDRSQQTTIGTVNVYTQATDGKGIAEDLSDSRNYLFASQGDGGIN